MHDFAGLEQREHAIICALKSVHKHLRGGFHSQWLAFTIVSDGDLATSHIQVCCSTSNVNHSTFCRPTHRFITVGDESPGSFHHHCCDFDSHASESPAIIRCEDVCSIQRRFDVVTQSHVLHIAFSR